MPGTSYITPWFNQLVKIAFTALLSCVPPCADFELPCQYSWLSTRFHHLKYDTLPFKLDKQNGFAKFSTICFLVQVILMHLSKEISNCFLIPLSFKYSANHLVFQSILISKISTPWVVKWVSFLSFVVISLLNYLLVCRWTCSCLLESPYGQPHVLVIAVLALPQQIFNHTPHLTHLGLMGVISSFTSLSTSNHLES